MARNGCKKIIIVNGHGATTACFLISRRRSSRRRTITRVRGGHRAQRPGEPSTNRTPATDMACWRERNVHEP